MTNFVDENNVFSADKVKNVPSEQPKEEVYDIIGGISDYPYRKTREFQIGRWKIIIERRRQK
ncbi:MAG: hypothetical protein J6W08_03380 [Alphaproteobacteria bacterium]|nr:hypothetical protein [Alphaproteobacteria bacterium]